MGERYVDANEGCGRATETTMFRIPFLTTSRVPTRSYQVETHVAISLLLVVYELPGYSLALCGLICQVLKYLQSSKGRKA